MIVVVSLNLNDTRSAQLLSNEGSQEGMLPVFASTAACDLLLKVLNFASFNLFATLLPFLSFLFEIPYRLPAATM